MFRAVETLKNSSVFFFDFLSHEKKFQTSLDNIMAATELISNNHYNLFFVTGIFFSENNNFAFTPFFAAKRKHFILCR